jgi:hypothetical protein
MTGRRQMPKFTAMLVGASPLKSPSSRGFHPEFQSEGI